MSFLRKKTFRVVISYLIFLIALEICIKADLAFALEEKNFIFSNSFSNSLKEWLEKTKISNLFPNFYLKLTAAIAPTPTESKKFIPQPMKDLSSFNLAIDRYYIRPWETSGLVVCEPWGVGNGISICLAPVFPGDSPCPFFMDCDGDGHYWFKGEDCDENCPTCYVGSKFFTEEPDGRDQDCDGLQDDNVECLPQYGAARSFGYDKECNFTYNTNYLLVNEGEVGEIPQDEIHCQKRWGQCTDYNGGFGNCTVSKTPGYFVKSNGLACGGGVWRIKAGDAIFDCGKALRPTSYRGYIGCGKEQCCRPRAEYEYEYLDNIYNKYICIGCECIQSPCPTCGVNCYPLPHPYDACQPGHCLINATFDYGANSKTNYGPWGLCHGYNEYFCQPMTGCERKFVENKYY